MNQLPEDVIIVIFNKLYVEALVNISQTCKYLNNISNYDSIWENRLKPKNRHYTLFRSYGKTQKTRLFLLRFLCVK